MVALSLEQLPPLVQLRFLHLIFCALRIILWNDSTKSTTHLLTLRRKPLAPAHQKKSHSLAVTPFLGLQGLEPRIAVPETDVLPITP